MDVMVLSTETGACVGVLKFTEEGSAIYDPITRTKKYTVAGVDFDPALVLPKMTSAERTSSVLKDGELVYDVTAKQIFVGNGVTSGGIACNAVPDERMTAAESSISSHSSQLSSHSSQLSLLETQISSATFPVLSAGSMTALPAGSDPTLDVVQSGSAFYLNMGVPVGSDGQPPALGAGSVTILPPGSESEFNLVYSSGAYFFDLAIPDGSLAQIQEYSSESAYAARDCITYSGGGYQVLEDTSAGENPENAPSKFICFAVAGVIGSNGITPIISGGSVTTLAPGESATATLTPGSGSEAHVYRLDLGLPSGSDGTNGSNGSMTQIQVYDSSSAYAALDCITYNGGGYQVLSATTAGENPDNEPGKFICFASAGADVQKINSAGSAIDFVGHEVARFPVTSGAVISMDSSGLAADLCITAELWLDMPDPAVSFSLPASLTWLEGAVPDFALGNRRYVITVRWDGEDFLANLAYDYAKVFA